MGWFKTGFESTQQAYDYDDSQHGPRRFWMPPDTTKRILFLDTDPTTFWEHNFRHNNSWQNWEPCKFRNKLADVCAVCARYPDRKPSFVGMFTVINMTPFESKKGRLYCYGRELYVAKLGGTDKPGVLKKLERLRKQHGSLTGCVFDVYRGGEKVESCGDDFTLIEKIEPAKITAYGKAQLAEWIKKINEKIDDPSKRMTLDKAWERAPWEPYNYDEILTIRSNEELEAMFGGAGPESGGEGDSQAADENAPY